MSKADEAMQQLARYGGEPHEQLSDVLWCLADLNDDLWHLRSKDILQSDCDKLLRETQRLKEML